MTTTTKRALVLALGAAAVLGLSADPAFAQAAGGGSGAFTSIYNWFMTNVWAGIVLIGIVAVGVMFWFGKAAVYIIAIGALGGLIVKFAPDIQAFFT